MEQIAVKANYLNLLPTSFMPDFSGTFFIDSNGKVSLNHEVLAFDATPISSWERMGKSTNGEQGINFWVAGECFLIIDDDQLSISVPFFTKHLGNLQK